MAYLLHQLLERTAAATPEKEALRFEGRGWTYGEVERRANQAAHALVRAGAQCGDRVGIYMRKGFEACIAMCGALKAGCAYVPLDPWLPAERVEFLLRDCGIRALFADSSRLGRLAETVADSTPLEVVLGPTAGEAALPSVVTIGWEEISSLPESAPEVALTELDLAYIFYTSGSTGEPKGMMHTHRSGLSFVEWTLGQFRVRPEDRIGNHAPLHFDLSLFDYFTAAAAGATTVIVSEERQKMPASVAQLIADERLSIWYSVPAAWTQMLLRGGLRQRDLSSLRLVIFGGEPFPVHLLRDLMAILPEAEFCHVYGVTETNVCTFWPVPRPLPAVEALPIGKLCPNMEGVVLDEDGGLAAPGEAGELAIRGPGVMEGYWNQPGLDSAAFWTRTGAGQRVERFYRTGDLVEPDAAGDLRFLGRRDRQVKSRGHRIELDEVQAALAAQPSVAEAAVYAVPDGEGSRQVEAAVVVRDGARWDESAVLRGVRERTAAYAAPARIRLMANLPRTSAGKVDFQRLVREASEEPALTTERAV